MIIMSKMPDGPNEEEQHFQADVQVATDMMSKSETGRSGSSEAESKTETEEVEKKSRDGDDDQQDPDTDRAPDASSSAVCPKTRGPQFHCRGLPPSKT